MLWSSIAAVEAESQKFKLADFVHFFIFLIIFQFLQPTGQFREK